MTNRAPLRNAPQSSKVNGIKPRIAALGNLIVRSNPHIVIVYNQPIHGTMFRHHPFGLPGRAGGVDHVGQVLGGQTPPHTDPGSLPRTSTTAQQPHLNPGTVSIMVCRANTPRVRPL